MHELQKVRQTDPPFLQERRAEFIFHKDVSPKERGSGGDDEASQKRLFGGNGGIAPPELGNVIKSFRRRSTNSEYLLFSASRYPLWNQVD